MNWKCSICEEYRAAISGRLFILRYYEQKFSNANALDFQWHWRAWVMHQWEMRWKINGLHSFCWRKQLWLKTYLQNKSKLPENVQLYVVCWCQQMMSNKYRRNKRFSTARSDVSNTLIKSYKSEMQNLSRFTVLTRFFSWQIFISEIAYFCLALLRYQFTTVGMQPQLNNMQCSPTSWPTLPVPSISGIISKPLLSLPKPWSQKVRVNNVDDDGPQEPRRQGNINERVSSKDRILCRSRRPKISSPAPKINEHAG